MTQIKLFSTETCTKCKFVKDRLPQNLNVEIVDLGTTDGMAEGAYYMILDKTLPVLVVDDKFVANDVVPVMKKLGELEKVSGGA